MNTVKITKSKLAKVLRTLAKKYDTGEFAWVQGVYKQGNNKVCTVGGIERLLEVTGHDHFITDNAIGRVGAKSFLKAAQQVLGKKEANYRIIPLDIKQFTDRAIEFNDNDETTKPQVVKVLRRTANLLEHGGQ